MQACDSCRSSKRKCDGGQPICGTCGRQGRLQAACVYEKPEARKVRMVQYVLHVGSDRQRRIALMCHLCAVKSSSYGRVLQTWSMSGTLATAIVQVRPVPF